MRKLSCLKIAILLALLPAFTTYSVAQKRKLIQVYIVDGFSNHDWKQTTKLTKWMLENTGGFAVDVSTISGDNLEQLEWKPSFKNYDVVVQNTNNFNNRRLQWSRHAEQELETFVKEGGGLSVAGETDFRGMEAFYKYCQLYN